MFAARLQARQDSDMQPPLHHMHSSLDEFDLAMRVRVAKPINNLAMHDQPLYFLPYHIAVHFEHLKICNCDRHIPTEKISGRDQ